MESSGKHEDGDRPLDGSGSGAAEIEFPTSTWKVLRFALPVLSALVLQFVIGNWMQAAAALAFVLAALSAFSLWLRVIDPALQAVGERLRHRIHRAPVSETSEAPDDDQAASAVRLASEDDRVTL